MSGKGEESSRPKQKRTDGHVVRGDEENEEMEAWREGEGHDEDMEMIDVEFEFFDPRPEDYKGVKQFLMPYLDKEQYGAAELADIVVGQAAVGTMIKVQQGADPYAFVTLLSIQQYKTAQCIKEVCSFVLKKCSDAHMRAQLQPLLDGKVGSLGLLLDERIINIPPQIIPHLHDALLQDIEWAIQNEPTGAQFQCTHVLVLSRCFQQMGSGQGSTSDSRGKKKGRAQGGENFYTKLEDELFWQAAELKFWYEVKQANEEGKHTFDSMLQERGIVMVLAAAKYKDVVAQLKQVVG